MLWSRKLFSKLSILVCVFATVAPSAQSIEPGQALPRLELTDSSGAKIDLDSLKGKIVYLDIWASWCGTCASTMPWLNQLQEKFGKQNLAVVAVNVDENREDAEKFLKDFNPQMFIAFDPKGAVPSELEVEAMPTSFLIDRQGKIISVHQGFKDSDRTKVEQLIANDLKGAKSA